MSRRLLFLSVAAFSVTTAFAQSYGPVDAGVPGYMQSAPAPIERGYSQAQGYPAGRARQPEIRTSSPADGVLVRTAPGALFQTVRATGDVTELSVTAGVVNVSVHRPEGHRQILVDLPDGQTALLKDGLYTFNASTNTVRVFKGEAEAFAGSGDRSVKVKEDHYLAFNGGELHALEGNATTARADILPGVYADRDSDVGERRGYGYNSYGDGYYGGYPYGYGFSPYPYYAYGYPGFGYYGGYPYGYGLGIGLGFGYYGGYGRGFYGGGYRGGIGAFRGRR